jgi:hypothetical protein
MSKTFDPKCYDLAAVFLTDHPQVNTDAAKVTLARAIQECIEDEIVFMEKSVAQLEDAVESQETKASAA